nr:RNA binding protein Nova 1 [Hymenolepis microstoma]
MAEMYEPMPIVVADAGDDWSRCADDNVKILVPNSTAGMIIGKNGTYIQEIKERSEAYVQISQKSREFSLPERCVIVAGELHQMRAAMDLILAVIASDPQSSSCPNLSYADVRGPVSSVYPTGSPFAFPFITTTPSNLLLRPDASSLAAVNPYLLGPLATPLNPMDAALILQLVNGSDQLSAIQQQQVQVQQQAHQVQQAQQNAALNTYLQMGGGAGNLPTATGAIVTANQQQQSQQASSTSPLATAAASLGSFCSNPAFLPAAMFDSLMPAAVAAAATGGPQARFPPSQYLSGRGPYTAAYAAPPFVSIQQSAPAFTSPSPPSSATPDAPTLQATAVLASVARGVPSGASTNPTTGAAQSAETLGIFDTGQRNPGDGVDVNSATVAAWEECSKGGGGGGDQQAYLTASAAALMGLYASVGGVVNSNAVVAAPSAAGAQLLRSSTGGAGGLLYTREILVPENLIGRISGLQGRLLIDLQTQTNTLIRVSPKPIYISGIQSRVLAISGDQMNVNYAAAIIENTVAIEQLNQSVLRRPYEEASVGYINQTSGKSNGVTSENPGEYVSSAEISAPPNVSCSAQASHPSPKQPAF